MRIRTLKPAAGVIDYAIGDVHGYHDHMVTALDWCAQDALEKGCKGRVHLLGDYVDRGPQSKEVIETLMVGSQHDHMTWLPIRGNHDHVLAAVWHDFQHELSREWWEHGGQQTLMSYGWSPIKHGLPNTIKEWIDPAHIQFLSSLPLANLVGDILFVHAGVRPNVTLPEQTDRDLMWIRGDFLRYKDSFGLLVVHGHSPEVENPVDHGNRVSLDSGCFFSGNLSIAAFDYWNTEPRFKGIGREEAQSFVGGQSNHSHFGIDRSNPLFGR
jgi:serine/threonine protein phosphatase 1